MCDLKDFLRKKMFYTKNLTKLPDLTVLSWAKSYKVPKKTDYYANFKTVNMACDKIAFKTLKSEKLRTIEIGQNKIYFRVVILTF